MKYLALTGLCFLLLVGNAQAETKYIRGSIKITMRTGPGTDHKIVRMLQTARSMNVGVILANQSLHNLETHGPSLIP